ncbi:hypothetical protein [Hydrogenimonas sp.]
MKLYYYVHTGHRVGLDRLRRSAPVINALLEMDVEVSLLTSDFRAGEFAKEQFGIRKYVSVDVSRNIANIATPADALVYDSQEEHRAMWEEMAGYFRAFVRISDEPEDFATKESGVLVSPDIVDPRYFGDFAHEGGEVYFWGDDDYDKQLLSLADAFEGTGVTLLEGYYFFMQYGDELAKKFAAVEESEAYDEALTGASRFLTSSPQSALEALAAGSRPLYVEKPGAKPFWRAKMARFGIPVVEAFSKDKISQKHSETTVYRAQLLRNDAAIEVASYIKDKLS